MTPLRRNPLTIAVNACLLLALPGLAAAQQDTTSSGQATTLDTVTVTGTRIKAEIEGHVPVQIVSREDIDRTGLTSIADVVQALTASGSALNTKFNSSGNFGFPPDGSGVGAGSAQVDLRHLGAKRVLVLVDGIRWVNEASASGVGAATDLNTIPLAIVERIEVLEDGASAIYGSDAIAGVVNIITRRSFDGASISVQYGEYSEGDGATGKVDLAWGHSTERSNLFIGASYNNQEEVRSSDREQSRFPVPGTGTRFGSSGTPTGRFIFRDPITGAEYDITPNTGVSNPVFDRTQTGCTRTDSYHCFSTPADRFNFSPFNLVVTPSERAGLFSQFRFEFSDNVNWYAKALYNRRKSTNQAAPEPIFLGAGAGTGNPLADNIFVSRTNPFNPFGFDLDSSSNLDLIGRRPVEGGPRIFEQEVDTWYVGTGFEGVFDIGERSWFWDVNAAYSENRAEQTNFGSYNIRNIALALGPLATCQASPGCVPLNIFGGPGTITPAMLAYIRPVVRDESENTLALFTANLSGELFQMWAGPLAFAAGYEFRKYEGFYRPDPINYVELGPPVVSHYNGVPSLPTSGEYDVNEVYTEFNIPLLADSTFGKKLDLSLAGRYSDYSTFGGEFTGKVGLRWQVVDELLLRATYAEGFRAPTIGELFGSASRFDAQIDDPCTEPFLDPSVQGNCRAMGVPPGFQQINPQISIVTGGNQNLEPERADSFTTGFVWSPGMLVDTSISQRVDFEVTYYRHAIEGAIQAIDAQTQLNLCVQTRDPKYCSGITRASTGDINSFNNRLTNLGVIKTDGWDIDLFWTFPDSNMGKFKMDWRNTFVGRYVAVGAAGQRQPQAPGVEVVDSAIPKWTSTFVTDWALNNWTAAWTIRHIDDLQEDCGRAVSFPVCSDRTNGKNTLQATTYHDLQVGYKLDLFKGLQLTAGVNNLFDEDPPICLSCSLNGYDASTYDIPGGQFWYLRADMRF